MIRNILVLVMVLLFATGTIVYADYNNKTRAEVAKQLNTFFQVEQGNRLTVYSMKSLLEEINKIFTDNIVVPKVPAKSEKEDK